MERIYIVGRFFFLWNGNGILDLRLRDWLGVLINLNIMDCMVYLFIEGLEVLCIDFEIYILINNMFCVKIVIWWVELVNLFVLLGSGNGVIVLFWGNVIFLGLVIFIYILLVEGCNDVEVEYDLFVGRLCIFELYLFLIEICVGE